MGATSNESKQSWNASHYTQLKVSVPPELAATFKARCKEKNVSMASEISRFMSIETKGCRPAKSAAGPYATRQKRRKALKSLVDQLEALMGAEQSYLENIPENLQSSCRYEDAEQTVSALEEALEILGEAY